MDAVEQENNERQKKWCVHPFVSIFTLLNPWPYPRLKDKKIGEGTYAVVYQGEIPSLVCRRCHTELKVDRKGGWHESEDSH